MLPSAIRPKKAIAVSEKLGKARLIGIRPATSQAPQNSTTEASRPSRRVGMEWTNQYQVLPWMRLDLDVAYTKARFTDFDPAGNFIPGAPAWVAAGGVTFGGESGWFGALRGRYFGPRPLIEDDSVRSQASLIVNARAGYRFDNGLKLQLDVLNLFNAKTNQIEYYYLSRLPGESIGGVADRHLHPAEPLAVRLTPVHLWQARLAEAQASADRLPRVWWGVLIVVALWLLLLGLLVALPIGIYSATRPYSFFDQLATSFAFIGFSLPTFFTGLLLILVFSIYLDWLPFIFQTDIDATGPAWVWAQIRQAIMPITVLGLFQAATLTRFIRSAVLDVIRLDYVNTARAKGLSERVTLLKHVVRNALIPVITLVALQLPGIFTGAVITEQIFRVPGIGSLLISSILANDTPVIMAVTFVFSCLVVLFNLVADVLYGWLDPRISYR